MDLEKVKSRQLSSLQIKTVIAKAIYCGLQWGAFKTYGVLLEATTADFAIPYYLVGLAFAIPGSFVYITAPIANLLLVIVPVRWVCSIGGLLAGGGYVINALTEPTFWNLLLSCSVTGVGFGLQSYPSTMCLMEHFGDDYAKYHCIALPFMYIGMSILPIILESLIARYGMRGATLVFGGLIFHSIITGVLISRGPNKETQVKNRCRQGKDYGQRKGYGDSKGDSEGALLLAKSHEDDVTQKQRNMFIEHPELIPFMYVYSTSMFLYGMWAMFLVPFAQRKGYDLSTAVYLSTFGGVGGFIGKVASVFIYSYKMNSTWSVFVLPCVVSAVVLAGSVFYYPYWFLAFSSFVSGFGIAVVHAAVNPTLQEIAPKNFSKALTVALFLCTPGTLIAGFVSGYIREESGSYDIPFLILAGVYISVAAIMESLRLCSRKKEEAATK